MGVGEHIEDVKRRGRELRCHAVQCGGMVGSTEAAPGADEKTRVPGEDLVGGEMAPGLCEGI